jgi:endonuclease/exonuclease/phosphatase family metal-dependent hydrolase
MSRTAAADPAALTCRQTIPHLDTAVSWIAPSDQHQRDALASWCQTLGPVVFEPSPRDVREDPIDRLAVVTWNTHVGAGDLDRVLGAVRSGSFTGGLRPDAVVLLLQEMYRHGEDVPAHPAMRSVIPGRIIDAAHAQHAHDAWEFARERGLAVLYAPSMRNGLLPEDPEDRGNAIVSTVPLAAPAVIELPLERQRRAVAVAQVDGRTSDGRAWQLRVADVHLDTALAVTRGGPLGARRRQAVALVTALTRELRFTGPTIVAGDFNTWMGDREPAIQEMRAAFPLAPGIAERATWRGPLGLHSKLDYVFAAGPLRSIRVQRLPDRFGSDHYPLIAVVSF